MGKTPDLFAHARQDDEHKPFDFSVKDLIQFLTSFCDGAKLRDGVGFNKADAQAGARLATMSKMGIPWGAEDCEAARSILKRYAKQASQGTYPKNQRLARQLEQRIRDDKLKLGAKTGKPSPFNYMHPSHGWNYVYLDLYKMPKEYRKFVNEVKALGELYHGQRRIRVSFAKNAPVTINGRKLTVPRWRVDLNSTSRRELIELAKRWMIVIDIRLLYNAKEPVVNRLSKHEKFCFLFNGTRKTISGDWCVFDLYRRDQEFSDYIKKSLKGKFICSKADDFNWFVPLQPGTISILPDIIRRFNFASCPELQKRLNL